MSDTYLTLRLKNGKKESFKGSYLIIGEHLEIKLSSGTTFIVAMSEIQSLCSTPYEISKS